MIKLILAGGGDAPDSKLADEFFVNMIPKGKKMLYIPIAMPPSEHSFDECFDWLKSVFNPLKFIDIVMWTDLSDKGYEDLKPFGAIYIGGGNTFSLLSDLRNTEFIELLKKFIADGRILYGGSAGAIILGKDIGTAALGKYADENLVNLTDTSGLDLVNGYDVHCHYEEKYDKEIFGYIKKHNSKIIAIPEKLGLLVEDGKIKVIGFESVYVFKNGEKIALESNSLLL
jgi:dipeptidase E